MSLPGGSTRCTKIDDVAAQLLLRRLPGAGLPRRVVGRAHRVDRRLQHLAVEPELVAEVVVDGGDVGARRAADVADGHLLEAAVGEQALGRLQQPIARLACRGVPSQRPLEQRRRRAMRDDREDQQEREVVRRSRRSRCSSAAGS